MVRAIFNLFRHGRAETLFCRDPFILIKTFAPNLVEDDDQELATHSQPIRIRWALFPTDGTSSALQMRWAGNADMARNEG